jgi:hypothetical protein
MNCGVGCTLIYCSANAQRFPLFPSTETGNKGGDRMTVDTNRATEIERWARKTNARALAMARGRTKPAKAPTPVTFNDKQWRTHHVL